MKINSNTKFVSNNTPDLSSLDLNTQMTYMGFVDPGVNYDVGAVVMHSNGESHDLYVVVNTGDITSRSNSKTLCDGDFSLCERCPFAGDCISNKGTSKIFCKLSSSLLENCITSSITSKVQDYYSNDRQQYTDTDTGPRA